MRVWILSFVVIVSILLNCVFLGTSAYFLKKSQDKASRIGFSIMIGTMMLSIIMILGGVFAW